MNAKGFSEQTRGAFWMRWAVGCSRRFPTLTESGALMFPRESRLIRCRFRKRTSGLIT
jgi:hypothetical protein